MSTRNGPRTTGSVSLLCAMTSTHRIICQALTRHNRKTISGISHIIVCHFAGSNLSRQRNLEHLRTNYRFVTQRITYTSYPVFFRDLSNKLLSNITAHPRFLFLLNHFLAARVNLSTKKVLLSWWVLGLFREHSTVNPRVTPGLQDI